MAKTGTNRHYLLLESLLRYRSWSNPSACSADLVPFDCCRNNSLSSLVSPQGSDYHPNERTGVIRALSELAPLDPSQIQVIGWFMAFNSNQPVPNSRNSQSLAICLSTPDRCMS